MSNSLPSTWLGVHSFACPQRSQKIILPSRLHHTAAEFSPYADLPPFLPRALTGSLPLKTAERSPLTADSLLPCPAFTVHVIGGRVPGRVPGLLTEAGVLYRAPCRKPESLAVALNWGIGSSSLNDVKGFARLHSVRGSNSGCVARKNRSWT